MIGRWMTTAGIAGFLLLSAGSAMGAAPTPVPDMKPALSSMSFMVGTWKCVATVRGKSRPDTITYSMALDGRWLYGHDVAPVFDKFRTRAIVGESYTTFNPLNHMWIQTGVDSFGGYGIGTSPGWKGNKITWTATVTSDGSTGSDTTTKVSDTKTVDVATGNDKSGKMQPTTTTTCNKQ